STGDRAEECSTGRLSWTGAYVRTGVECSGRDCGSYAGNWGGLSGGIFCIALRDGMDGWSLGHWRPYYAQEPVAGAGPRRAQHYDLDRRSIFKHHIVAGINVPRERGAADASS